MKKFLVSLMVTALFLTGCGSKEEEEVLEVPKEKEVEDTEEYNSQIEEEKKPKNIMNLNGYTLTFDDLESLELGKITIENYTKLDQFVENNLVYDRSINDDLEFKDVRRSIDESKDKFVKKNQEFARKYEPVDLVGDRNYRKGDYPFLSDEEFLMLCKDRPQNSVDKKQAKEDAVWLDRAFRTHLGGLKIFGRDNFNNAHYRLLKDIEEYSEDKIKPRDFTRMIVRNYDFIYDAHHMFSFGYRSQSFVHSKTDGYYFDDYYFLKDNDGYYLKDYSPKTYIKSINGNSDLSEYMHYSICSNGELAYMISCYLKEFLPNNIFKLELGNNIFDIRLKQMDGAEAYKEYEGSNEWVNEVESFTGIDGYPVVAQRCYSNRGGSVNPDKLWYQNMGNVLKGQDVVIHDTRSNGGGNIRYADGFYYNLTGIRYDRSFSEGRYRTTSGLWDEKWEKDSFNGHILPDRGYLPWAGIPRTDNYSGYNDLLITLTDAKSGSSGEGTVDYTKAIVGAIVIGEPTSGCVLGDAGTTLSLPNSGIWFNCSPSADYQMGLQPDGVGTPPDIWVDSDEALDKTIEMLKYYDIKPSNNVSEIIDKYTKGTNDCARCDLEKLDEKKHDKSTNTYTVLLDGKVNYDTFYPMITVKDEKDNIIYQKHIKNDCLGDEVHWIKLYESDVIKFTLNGREFKCHVKNN